MQIFSIMLLIFVQKTPTINITIDIIHRELPLPELQTNSLRLKI